MVTEVSYTDHLHGKASEMTVTVHDKDGWWKSSWYPEIGSKMQLTIFDAEQRKLPCGLFELDQPNASGGRDGDLMTISGLAAPVTKPLRTQKTKAYERINLADVVHEVAGRVGLGVMGEINDLFFERITQRRERDLEFLKLLANETGHYFNLRGDFVVFTSFKSVDGRKASLEIPKADVISYDFFFESTGTYSKGEAKYLDQNKGKLTRYEEVDPKITTGDVLKISGERLESLAQAEARVKSELHRANRGKFSGSCDLVGNALAVAGNTVNLTGFGRYDGKRLIDSSTHTLSRDGHEVSLELVDARA
ncbi:hypothetical protein J7443_09660 [Tropicibacter sp. R15_0]|uniref:phage late control D family protein n=1 Tax=Tropicibacter sp. R15_0 TaxID=2821101 RepID=UPI001ADB1BD4|nr:hypothetical protein [Tropicibacter sp. R15_0]MBO9465492.1 hypothetical protein [Tropicibacter sp. R15_0]